MTPEREQITIRPQPKQEEFLSSSADIAIYGGAAGGGKSYALLLEPLRHKDNQHFGGVIFRRDRVQVTNEGGLWDEAATIYPMFGGQPNSSDLYYQFPSGATFGFAGLQHETDVLKWQGSQIPFLAFDELTHFSQYQFFYMLSRNRSARAGVRSYVRATTNPDAESWVADFISWWIDPHTGFPILERAGVVRWLVRNNDRNFWYPSKQAAAEAWPLVAETYGIDAFAKSVTFIPADVFDNPALIKNDPNYLANLLALPLIERERLLKGNWKIKASAGKVYNRDWFEIVEAVGTGGLDVRFFDLAATAKKIQKKAESRGGDDPDYTATVKLRKRNGVWTVIDAYQIQTAPANVEKLVFELARQDLKDAKANGCKYKLRWEIEPGSASIRENQRWVTMLQGIDAKGVVSRIDKLQRARACSVQAEVGNVKLLRGPWNNELLTNLHGFPDLNHDDLFDALSGAFNESVDSSIVLTS